MEKSRRVKDLSPYINPNLEENPGRILNYILAVSNKQASSYLNNIPGDLAVRTASYLVRSGNTWLFS